MKKLISITAIVFLVLFPACSPSPKEKPTKKVRERPKTQHIAKKEHKHTERKEQSACPACNARLLIEKGYREITTEELKKLLRSDEAFMLIDVLEFYNYRMEHILNSISIPLEQIEETVPKLFNKDTKIVVYCQGYHCTFSSDAAEKLVKLGYTKIFDYKGGIDEWKEKGNKISGLRGIRLPPKQ